MCVLLDPSSGGFLYHRASRGWKVGRGPSWNSDIAPSPVVITCQSVPYQAAVVPHSRPGIAAIVSTLTGRIIQSGRYATG